MENPSAGEILKSTLTSIVRHFLSIVAAYLISKGLVAPEILSEGNLLILAGGIAAGLISLGWIIYRKLSAERLLREALKSPVSTPIETVKTNAAEKPLL